MGLIRAWAAWALWLGASLAPAPSLAQSPPGERFIVLASTTSTEQSGLFAHLLPAFTAATGIGVRVLALGTGQALDTPAGAMPTCCWCTTGWPKTASSPTASPPNAAR